MFAKWDKPDSAGCTCAVMHGGDVVYSRAFGLANLEHDVPLTPQSVFIVGSVSKLRWNRVDTLAMIPWRIRHPIDWPTWCCSTRIL